MSVTQPPAVTAPSGLTAQVIQRHDRHMSNNYARQPIVMVQGQGSTLVDADGKSYLDLFCGFGAGLLGHAHPALVRAVNEQAQKLWHPGNTFHTEPQTLLAEQIARQGFGGKSFFAHSGADANEAAIKLARLYGAAHPATGSSCGGSPVGRYKIVTALHSFHGRTFGAMVATGQPKVSQGFDPLLQGFAHVPFNDLEAMRRAIDPLTVAIMVEPIQGEGGINVPDDGYLPGLRRLCDEHDLLLICDEVWTGGGRTGRWFAHQHWGIEPDVMTLAKGVGGGLPVGVICVKDRVARLFDHREHGRVVHATTLGGNCLSMAVAHAVFHTIEREGLVQHAAQLGEHAMSRLRAAATRLPLIKQVRGRGLFIGVELQAQESPALNAAEVVRRCRDRGLLINATQDVVLRIAPAINISRREIDQGLDILESVLAG